MSNIEFFKGVYFEFVSKIEGHKHNNGTRHEKYHFTDHQSDLTNDSGGVQASFFLWSLAMVRSTLWFGWALACLRPELDQKVPRIEACTFEV